MAWHFALCNELFHGWPLERVAILAAEMGYEGLELAPFTLTDDVQHLGPAERQGVRRAVEAAGLRVAGLHWLLAQTQGLQLNDPDPEVRERTAQYLLALVDLCADLGGRALVFGSPQQRSLRPGWPRAQATASATEIFRRCGERAQARDVVFCLESLTTQETDFLTSAAETMAMVRQVGHPGLQMVADTRAMSTETLPVAKTIRRAAPWLRHVHLNDPNRLGPGMGDLDFVPILRALREVGYTGWLSVEPFDPAPGPERIARESLAYLTHCMERIAP